MEEAITATILCSGPSAQHATIPDGLLCCVNGSARLALDAKRQIDMWVMIELPAGAVYGHMLDRVLSRSPHCQIVVSLNTLKGQFGKDHSDAPHIIYDELDNPSHYMISEQVEPPRTSGVCAIFAVHKLWAPKQINIIGMDGYKGNKLYAENCGSGKVPHPNQVLEAQRSNEHWYNKITKDLAQQGVEVNRL